MELRIAPLIAPPHVWDDWLLYCTIFHFSDRKKESGRASSKERPKDDKDKSNDKKVEKETRRVNII